jgi:hypothetical protein
MNTRLRQRTRITDLTFGTWNIQTMLHELTCAMWYEEKIHGPEEDGFK